MNIINSSKYFIAGVAAGLVLAASAVPVVEPSSVSARQDNIKRTVKIEYQLTGEPGIVTIDIQTNVSEGVWASIGGEHYQTMYGAVNRINTNLTTKSYAYWQPDVDWESNDPTKVNVRTVVTAWSTNSPPDYMVVDLIAMSNFLFYANAESLPGGIGARKYKTDYIVMRKIPAKGVTWRMGSPTTETGRPASPYFKAEPARLVVLTNDYYLGVYELTQKQFWNITDGGSSPTPSAFKDSEDADIRPLENLGLGVFRGGVGLNGNQSWPEHGHDVAYSKTTPKDYQLGYLRVKTGLLFDLPTSAQWEYACRAGTSGRFNDGTDSPDAVGWYASNWENDTTIPSNMPHVVGLLAPNKWGLYDMHGNVREHVLERYYWPEAEEGVTYLEPTIPAGTSNPLTSESDRYITRGGGYADADSDCRSAAIVRIQSTSSKVGYRLWLPVEIPHLGKPMEFR